MTWTALSPTETQTPALPRPGRLAPGRQQRLFRCNRARPGAAVCAEIEAIESDWIPGRFAELAGRVAPLSCRAEWLENLAALLERERAGGPAATFLAEDATRAQFASVVAEFAPDGLTEAQNFFPAIPRLPIRAQMAVMRVLIDEFGCGNLAQAHSQLYRDLLAELGLPLELESFLSGTHDQTFEFLNIFHWLTQRAPEIDYFLGALAYLEASIPHAFTVHARACARLGVEHGRYYTEHIHIDTFHMKEMQVAIRECELGAGLDYAKVWTGAVLVSELLADAFDAAVASARVSA